MSQSPGLEAILADLAAGVIDTTEATRRIEALSSRSAPDTDPYDDPAPARDEYAAGRAQYAQHATERAGQAGQQPARDQSERQTDGSDEPAAQQASTARPEAQHAAEAAPSPAASTSAGTVRRIVIRATGRLVRVIGDPSVPSAEAHGPHTLRRNGELLEVTSESDIGPSLRGFSIVNPPRSAEDLRRLGFGPELVVRVNPKIDVDAEITGGGLTTVQVPRLGRIRVTAGGANLADVVAVRDALVQAGGATVRGPISEGRNRVRVESGSLSVGLYPQANVTVTAQARLGMVSWPEGQPKQLDEYVAGNGAARLDLSVMMGHISVRDEQAPQAETDDQESQHQWWEVWRH
ncbi:hypothetical protein SAMN05443377_10747 [Propionibacterium cyclohexanicum]|uniref:Adhesin domain-containing protein n=1 Tax=Propionibacterium cyclohexanicum TaxID=64702 RepID=A0A1H9RGK2_9ACTN|nr:hypothetical protein [Propionibacterium cyclohexanicum]SER71747.1 hypothetical protein SAMN05443377_10747 [Propionibacterium cyclohexanicum]